MKREVTILLATYNGAKYIELQISSILNQTFSDFVLYVLDDNSKDDTVQRIQRKFKDDRIKLFRNNRSLGVVGTFEKLLSMVETKYFCLADQDDVWYPEKVEKSITYLKSKKSDLVYTDVEVVDEKLNLIHASLFKYRGIKPLGGNVTKELFIRNPVIGFTICARSSILKKALPFPKGIPIHDWWLALVASAMNGIACLRESTAKYRQHSDNSLGVKSFGIENILSYWRKFNGDIERYLEYRDRRRFCLVKGFNTKFETKYSFLSFYYSLNRNTRFLFCPLYFAYYWPSLRKIGVRSLVSDVVMNSFPPFLLAAILKWKMWISRITRK